MGGAVAVEFYNPELWFAKVVSWIDTAFAIGNATINKSPKEAVGVSVGCVVESRLKLRGFSDVNAARSGIAAGVAADQATGN